jgi:hypothetical protein
MEIIILQSPQSDDQKYRKSKNSFSTVLLGERERERERERESLMCEMKLK